MESFVASIDVGTTSLKAALLSRHGTLLHPQTAALKTWSNIDGTVEQQPEQWYSLLADITREWWRRGVDPASIQMIAMTGQMQNLIAVGRDGTPLGHALLYSDVRASAQADSVNLRFGKEALLSALGNPVTAGSLLPKLIFLRLRYPDLFKEAHKVLFGAKDYLIHVLCGESVCDPTTASTTGLLLLRDRVWADELLEAYGFAQDLMPRLCEPEETVGGVSDSASAVTGFVAGTPVICGVGDAAATALGVGPADMAEPYLYVGTTGWLAQRIRASDLGCPAANTVFTLCSSQPDAMIRIAPVLNAGNVLAWALTLVGHVTDDDPTHFFEVLETEAAKCDDAGALTFVPYVSPERCPVETLTPHGAFIGISAQTTRAQMLRAVFDGVAQSLRWCGSLLNIEPGGDMIAIGGGTRSKILMQTIADACGKTLHLRPHSDMLAAVGVASIAAERLGWRAGFDAYYDRQLEKPEGKLVVSPSAERSFALQSQHAQFRQIAKVITSL
ncbi:xylulokinase [Paraburkholderia jirisanensis]